MIRSGKWLPVPLMIVFNFCLEYGFVVLLVPSPIDDGDDEILQAHHRLLVQYV